jgi:hypothetical protein
MTGVLLARKLNSQRKAKPDPVAKINFKQSKNV